MPDHDDRPALRVAPTTDHEDDGIATEPPSIGPATAAILRVALVLAPALIGAAALTLAALYYHFT